MGRNRQKIGINRCFPHLITVALAEKLDILAKAVKIHLVNHKDDDIIERISPAKNGYWKVKECTKPLGWQHHKI